MLLRGEFEYILVSGKDKKKDYIKVISYVDDANGYVEIARIRQIKNHWSKDGFLDMKHLHKELDENKRIRNCNAYPQREKGSEFNV